MKSTRRRFDGARWLWWLSGCALLFVVGCAYSLVNGGRINQKQADRIEVGIQDIRQLHFKNSVPLTIKTADEAEAMMEADLTRDFTDAQLQVSSIAGALVGLYPTGMDLKAEALKLLRNQVAGFYDSHGKAMVLIRGGPSLGFWNTATEFMAQRDVVGEMLLAHELTHALQDQNFDLETKFDKVKDDDDRALALKAVAEGDASLAGFAYSAGRMDDTVADVLVSSLSDLPSALAAESPDTPEGVSAPMVFQYTDGVKFVAEAYRRGGWNAVDALYSKPPVSTHQIMHSAVYFNGTAPPPTLTVSGYDKIMDGWKKVDDDTFGELQLRVILTRNLGPTSNDLDLSSRWIADRMIVLQESRGVNVIWMIAFSDEQSASHFAVVYATLLDRLLGDVTAHRIDYRSNAVLIVIGEGANYFDRLAPAIWNSSAIQTGTVSAKFTQYPAANDR